MFLSNHLHILMHLEKMYHQMKAQPSNHDNIQECTTKERALSKSFMQYLAGTGPFADWRDQHDGFEDIMVRTSHHSVIDEHFHTFN
jgi:hypothetical protein